MGNYISYSKDRKIIVDKIDDFNINFRFDIINKLKGIHKTSPKLSFQYKGYNIDIYKINDYFLMHCPCRWWNFVLMKKCEYSNYEEMKEECMRYLDCMKVSKPEQQSLFQNEDEKTVERLENFYNEQHSSDEEVYL